MLRNAKSNFELVRTLFCTALCALSFSTTASAQPEPTPGSPPPSSSTPPPALAPSPLLSDQASAPPPAAAPAEPTYPGTEAEPVEPAPPPPAPPMDEPPPRRSAGPFSQGSVRLTLLLGTGSTISDTYFILGGGVGYFLVNGLEVGVDYEAWLFGSPVMQRLSPETRYVLWFVPTIKPYIGAFYRHTFVNDFQDFDYLGGRAGIYFAPERSRFYIGGGAVYEHMLSCKDGDFIECDQVYPEISIGITF